MHRFFIEREYIDGNNVFIDREEAAHIKVLRLSPGDEIALTDGCGKAYLAKLLSSGKDGAKAEIVDELPDNEASVNIHLYQGMPKSDKLELIAQKLTELGAVSITPVYFERSDVKGDFKKADRINKIVREAAKQCKRARVLTVNSPISSKQLPDDIKSKGLAAVVPWEEGGLPLAGAAKGLSKDVAVIIGPEGGITENEIELFKSAGAVPVTLGKRILRTETAAIATVSALMCLLGQWE